MVLVANDDVTPKMKIRERQHGIRRETQDSIDCRSTAIYMDPAQEMRRQFLGMPIVDRSRNSDVVCRDVCSAKARGAPDEPEVGPTHCTHFAASSIPSLKGLGSLPSEQFCMLPKILLLTIWND